MTKYSMVQFDSELELKEAGLVASSAAESTILDLGDGLVDGFLVLDLTAVEVDSGDELYEIYLEGSNVAAMTSGSVALARFKAGDAAVAGLAPDDADVSTGRYMIPFRNEVNGTIYRYVRVGTIVAGTIATGINYSAFLADRHFN